MEDKSTNTNTPLTLDSVKAQVDQLTNQVKKNSKAIVDTGRHLLRLEVDKERSKLSGLRLGGDEESRIPQTESDDEDEDAAKGAISQDDIVELVTELQGQLDILDDRSVRRTANMFVQNDSDAIAPLPGRDGVPPGDDEEGMKFPSTLDKFKSMTNDEVEFWLRWYELLPPDEQELQDILKRAGTSMQEMGVEQKDVEQATEKELDANFDKLARYLGLRTRRTQGVW